MPGVRTALLSNCTNATYLHHMQFVYSPSVSPRGAQNSGIVEVLFAWGRRKRLSKWCFLSFSSEVQVRRLRHRLDDPDHHPEVATPHRGREPPDGPTVQVCCSTVYTPHTVLVWTRQRDRMPELAGATLRQILHSVLSCDVPIMCSLWEFCLTLNKTLHTSNSQTLYMCGGNT